MLMPPKSKEYYQKVPKWNATKKYGLLMLDNLLLGQTDSLLMAFLASNCAKDT